MKFITPVSMMVTKEQFEADLREPLEEMGYKIGFLHPKFRYITNHNLNGLIDLCRYSDDLDDSYMVDDLSNYSPKQFLALAAMTDSALAYYGEFGYFDKRLLCNKIHNSDQVQYDRKANKEELIEHFTNKDYVKDSFEQTNEFVYTGEDRKVEFPKPKSYWLVSVKSGDISYTTPVHSSDEFLESKTLQEYLNKEIKRQTGKNLDNFIILFLMELTEKQYNIYNGN